MAGKHGRVKRSSTRPENNVKKKRSKHYVYKFFTLVLLIVFIPAGLIMLWKRRPIRWYGTTKLMLSIIALLIVMGFMTFFLLHNFEDPTMQKIQLGANNTIDAIVNGSGKLAEEAGENWKTFADNAPEVLAVAGDQAIALLQDAVATPVPEELRTAEPTDAPLTFGATKDPDVILMGTPDRPTPTGALATVTPSPTPKPGETAAPTFTPTPSPTVVPTPTPVPTIDPATIPAMRTIGEFTVYYTSDGKYYHKTEVCGSMKNAKAHTLSDAVRAGKDACPYCNPLSADMLQITDSVYIDTDGYFHINFGCESITESYRIVSLDEAIADASVKACDACGAIYYTEGKPAMTAADVIPTAEPSNVIITENGNLTVYYIGNGTTYHSANTCSTMPGKTLLPIHLDDALTKGLTPCTACNAPEAEPID